MISNINVEDINHAMRQEKIANLKEDKEFFAVSGKTGSGKSSLLTFLLGFEPVFERKGVNYFLKHQQMVDQANKNERPVIGNSNESCTESSLLYFDKENNAFYDLAGLFDTKGPTQEIINALSISRIFQRGRKIKLLLVIQINSLYEARGSFINDYANLLKNQFGEDFQNLTQSMAIIFSKVNPFDYELSDIEQVIMELINGNKSISQHCELMFNQIIQNKRIAIFPTPCKNFDHFISKVKQVVHHLPSTMLSRNANLSLSDSVRHSLIQLGHDTTSKIRIINESIVKNMKDYFERTKNKFETNMQTLLKAQSMISSPLILGSRNLSKLLSELSIPNELSDDLIASLNILNFCQKTQNKQINSSILQTLRYGIQEIFYEYQNMMENQASSEQKKQLKQKLFKTEKELQKRQQAELDQIKMKQKRVLEEIEKQSQAMKNKFKEIQIKQENKKRQLQEYIRIETEKKRRIEIEQQRKKQQVSSVNYSKQHPYNHPSQNIYKRSGQRLSESFQPKVEKKRSVQKTNSTKNQSMKITFGDSKPSKPSMSPQIQKKFLQEQVEDLQKKKRKLIQRILNQRAAFYRQI